MKCHTFDEVFVGQKVCRRHVRVEISESSALIRIKRRVEAGATAVLSTGVPLSKLRSLAWQCYAGLPVIDSQTSQVLKLANNCAETRLKSKDTSFHFWMGETGLDRLKAGEDPIICFAVLTSVETAKACIASQGLKWQLNTDCFRFGRVSLIKDDGRWRWRGIKACMLYQNKEVRFLDSGDLFAAYEAYSGKDMVESHWVFPVVEPLLLNG